MEEIKELINSNEEFSDSQILAVFNIIGQTGDVIILKNDGLRDNNKFTVVISHSGESIRYDDSNLSNAVKKALQDYVTQKK